MFRRKLQPLARLDQHIAEEGIGGALYVRSAERGVDNHDMRCHSARITEQVEATRQRRPRSKRSKKKGGRWRLLRCRSSRSLWIDEIVNQVKPMALSTSLSLRVMERPGWKSIDQCCIFVFLLRFRRRSCCYGARDRA